MEMKSRRQPHARWCGQHRIYYGKEPSYRHTHLLSYVLTATSGLHHEPCCSSLNVQGPFILPGAERLHWSACFVLFSRSALSLSSSRLT
jgi:hypothetical protein